MIFEQIPPGQAHGFYHPRRRPLPQARQPIGGPWCGIRGLQIFVGFYTGAGLLSRIRLAGLVFDFVPAVFGLCWRSCVWGVVAILCYRWCHASGWPIATVDGGGPQPWGSRFRHSSEMPGFSPFSPLMVTRPPWEETHLQLPGASAFPRSQALTDPGPGRGVPFPQFLRTHVPRYIPPSLLLFRQTRIWRRWIWRARWCVSAIWGGAEDGSVGGERAGPQSRPSRFLA